MHNRAKHSSNHVDTLLIDAIIDQQLDREEIEYALKKARGIIIGYAMEYRALRILEKQGFKDLKLVAAPTHDIEATRNGKKYYIEVKASRYNPTKHYTSWKIAMITLLNGEHYTLIIRPDNKPVLKPTKEILSLPKKTLYSLLKAIKNKDIEQLRKLANQPETKKTLKQYSRTIKWFTQKLRKQENTEKQNEKQTQ